MTVPSLKLLESGYSITFATPSGDVGNADKRMLDGHGLGFFNFFFKAPEEIVRSYNILFNKEEFQNPKKFSDIKSSEYQALFLPGGHAKGMRPYLESRVTQQLVVDFFHKNLPVAAICHGTLLVARSIDERTNRSVLFERKTTGLNFRQEYLAWNLTRAWVGDYYRTYSTYMEDEVVQFLKNKENFIRGPIPLFKDSTNCLKHGFTVRDKNYLSARWPGDIHQFTNDLIELLQQHLHVQSD